MLADEGKCVILVTHSATVAAQADAVYELKKAAPAKKAKKRPTPPAPRTETLPPPPPGGSTLGLD